MRLTYEKLDKTTYQLSGVVPLAKGGHADLLRIITQGPLLQRLQQQPKGFGVIEVAPEELRGAS